MNVNSNESIYTLTKHSQVGESAERKESISVDELDPVSAQVSVEQ